MKTNLTTLAKNLRKNSTDAERVLWRHLCAKQLRELKFRRQVPIGSYIVDFVCFIKKLIVELDGSQHAEEQGKNNDQKRDAWLQSQGFTIIHFWNNDVLQNMEGVWEKICENIQISPSPTPPIKGGVKR